MQTGWVYLEGEPENASKDTIENWRYFAESGIQNATLGASITGWLSLNPPEQLQDNVDEPVVWYYFEKDGTPKTGPVRMGAMIAISEGTTISRCAPFVEMATQRS